LRIIVFVISLLTVGLSGVVVFAGGGPVLAPVNPAFLHYLQAKQSNRLLMQTSTGHALGLIPSPVDLSHLKGQTVQGLVSATLLPSSYDLRTTGKLTPVKNQSSCGDCWAFGTYDSLESALLPSETWDFSENNLKDTSGFDLGACDGGNAQMSMAYLGRWSGAIKESDDPYNPISSVSPSGLSPVKHVQNVIYIPAGNQAAVKQALMTYGALYTEMYYADSSYNPAYDAYYFNGTADSNHAVGLVGWDDNFDKSKFSPAAPGNGAWIIKNSWGTGWGDSGYFYISYYDADIATNNFAFEGADPTTKYDRVYQYDPLGWVGNIGNGANTAWFSNIFTAGGNDRLKAVSFYVSGLNAPYVLYIYTGVTAGAPTSGSLAFSQSGTLADAGYHTIPLASPVELTSGENFSVVVKLTTPGYNYPIALEEPESGYSSTATASAGQSFISLDGAAWDDLTTYFTNSNVCLKAFAKIMTPDKIGVFDNGYWYLDSNMSWAWDGTPTDTLGIFGVGLTGAIPVVGDWNGDGTTKIGVYMNGTWYLDMNRNWQWDGQPADRMYSFGAGLPGAVPVVGDWNGDGTTKIGIYSNGVWYLDMNGNGQWDGEPTDKIAYFGAGLNGAVPVVGDWNGDGKTKIGIYQNGYWYLDVNGNGQWDGAPTDQLGVFGVGLTNAVPVTGDWNADGVTEIGIYQQGLWYLDKNRSWQWEGEPADQFGVFGVGLTGAVPVPGKW
jgi:C1A family cysteine protease